MYQQKKKSNMFKNVLSSISFYVNVRRILLYVKIEIIIFKNVQVQNITKNWFTHKPVSYTHLTLPTNREV